MSTVEKSATTLEEFLRLPEFWPPLEFYGGRIIQKVSPKPRHCLIQLELCVKLRDWSRPDKRGRVFPELRCNFGKNSYVFDLSYFVAGRLPKLSDLDDRDDITIAPDLVVEITSPGQALGESKKKLRTAIRRGARLGWLIHSPRKQVIVMKPRERSRTLQLGDALSDEEVLPGFSLTLDEMFSWLDEG